MSGKIYVLSGRTENFSSDIDYYTYDNWDVTSYPEKWMAVEHKTRLEKFTRTPSGKKRRLTFHAWKKVAKEIRQSGLDPRCKTMEEGVDYFIQEIEFSSHLDEFLENV